MLSTDYQVVPVSTAPSQTLGVTLNGQPCTINIFTKSINVPIQPPGDIASDPLPTYENKNPVFLNLYVNNVLIIGGVLCLNNVKMVRDAYLGFIGDLAFIDLQGDDDPYGVPPTLPPPDLRNWWQRNVPLIFGGKNPPAANPGTCPGLGTRFVLTYWPNIT